MEDAPQDELYLELFALGEKPKYLMADQTI